MKILLRRPGGHGDILCLTAAIPGLKAKYPDAEIHFQVKHAYSDLILGHPDISVIWQTAGYVPAEELAHFDLVLEPDHGHEWNDAICRVQCRMLGVPFGPPQLHLHPDELRHAPESDICIANHSVDARVYRRMRETVKLLHGRRRRILQVDGGPNLGAAQPAWTLRQAACAIAKTRLLLTVDTAHMHIGAALRKPMVVIFGELTGAHNQYVPDAWLASTKDAPERLAELVNRRLKRSDLPKGCRRTNERSEVIG